MSLLLRSVRGSFELVTREAASIEGKAPLFLTTLHCLDGCGGFCVVVDLETEAEARECHAACVEFLTREPYTYDGCVC